MAAKGGKKGPPIPSVERPGVGRWSRKNYAPVLLLTIGDKPADDILRLCTSFNYKRATGKSSETTFIFRNDDRRLLDDPRFFPNTTWKFRFGYYDDLSPVVTAVIREVTPTYAEKRTVTVKLFDTAMTMSTQSHAKNWGRIKSSEIAKAIAKAQRPKLFYAVDPTNDVPTNAWIQPNNVNDLQFLRDLASLIDYEVFVDGTPPVLYYRAKPYSDSPVSVLTYYDDPTHRSSVLSFTPTVKSLGPVATGIASTDAQKGKGDKATNVDPTKGGPALAFQLTARGEANPPGWQHRSRVVVKTPTKDVAKPAPSGAKTDSLVQAARQQMLDKSHEASSSHPLTSSLNAGKIYEWRGIEKQLAGKWYCVEEDHTITGSNSSTKAKWKRNASGAGTGDAAKNTNNKKAAGDQPVGVPKVQVTTDGSRTVVFARHEKPPSPKAPVNQNVGK